MAYASRLDQALAAKRHYQKNAHAMKERAKAHKKIANERNRSILNAHLKTNPCVDCGESDITVLDFDHVREKKIDNVTTMAANSVSAEKLIAEIRKCEIRCANCHRKATKRRRAAKKHEKIVASNGINNRPGKIEIQLIISF
jgi:hypothetical protein